MGALELVAMGNGSDSKEVDIHELLERVHGRSDESRREDQVDDALRAIESTHRAASMAVRNFERTGRLEAEANVLAALGALADDSHAPDAELASTSEKTSVSGATPGATPEATKVWSPRSSESSEVTQAMSPPDARVTGAEVTAAFVKAPPLPPQETPFAGAEATQAYVPPTAARPDSAPRAPRLSDNEVTRTYSIEQAPPAPRAAPPQSASAAPARQEREPTDPRLKPERVFSGQGKSMPAREVTRTNVVRRPKR